MRRFLLGVVAFSTIIAGPGASLAQGLSIGPGGVRIDDGRGPPGYRRGYSEEGGRRRGMCRELRQACLHKEELGEQGAGNCRRYRRMCG
ncbi:conserved hypothetical protein [Methylobacterium sp. 4-46]|uniref:hypothetical protein n=1 Tax=unclassified Methylobacterium TaxID=2615210 RepID=UPI000152D9E6|nr:MULTISPECIES: hypothetical protein [Methylobacterium]ACA20196.1 conserved hypothetical protein [Methylobacterium sp. 4-46]WFT79376.1 hypothetical protein QA634_29870 [Methylobacterium nodulans]